MVCKDDKGCVRRKNQKDDDDIFPHPALWQILVHLSHYNSVRLSVCPSVCHTGGSIKNGAS